MQPTFRRATARFLFVACITWVAVGCSRADKFVPVKGRVTINGQPLAAAGSGIAFIPDTAKGNTSPHEPRGQLSATGEYELSTANQPGAPPGWYKVLVLAHSEPASAKDPYAVPKWLVPIEYTKADKTLLSVEVVAQPAADAYDFDVKKK
jgi:hypothetical protein